MDGLGRFARISKSNSDRILVLILIVVIGVLYSPTLNAIFQADDFHFLDILYFNIQQFLNGQLWKEWFIGSVYDYAFFRPIGNLFWLLNYVAFGLEPFGYHISSILLHLIASFAVFVLSHLLTRNRMASGIGAIIFAVMPVHSEAVSWVSASYDLLSGMMFFVALIFYILYRQRGGFKFYLVALGAFVLGLSSKETALTLPVILFLYDLLYHSRDWTSAWRVLIGYIPFEIVLAIRFLLFGHGWGGLIFAPEGWLYYVDLNLLRVFDPLPQNVNSLRWLALGCALLLLMTYRLQAQVFFGLAWIPITLFPTTVGGVSDRSFYIPSFGVSLLLAIVITTLLARRTVLVRAVGLFGLVLIFVAYGAALFARNQASARASQVAQAILYQVQQLHHTLPADARMVFVGVPDFVPEGPMVFITGFPHAMHIIYQNPSLRVLQFSKFPIWLDDLDHTYFFLVDHRRVAERADLLAALEARKYCAGFSQVALTWDLGSNPQGWEPWNQLDGFENRDGALVTRSVGDNPVMASPVIDISALAIGDIDITMRVRAEQPTFEGKVYWMASEQQDFSPALKQSFIGQADGEFHTYHVDIAQTGMLLLDDRITRLRLDPVTMPAEIAIKSIQVNVHCKLAGTGRCTCGQ